MKRRLFLYCAILMMPACFHHLNAQPSGDQYISPMYCIINIDKNNDQFPDNRVDIYDNHSIRMDYDKKVLEIIQLENNQVLISTTWKKEIHPDKIKSDATNEFIFNGKNSMQLKILRVYQLDNGTATFSLTCSGQIMQFMEASYDGDKDGNADQ